MSYIDVVCVTTSLICFSTTILSNSNLLTLLLISSLVYKLDHIQNPIFYTLIDSRSIYYFINTIFALKYNIFRNSTSPIELKLLDKLLNNIISKTAFLPIIFPSGDQMILNIYIIFLNSFYLLVLKYNWLTQHSLTINWATKSITS